VAWWEGKGGVVRGVEAVEWEWGREMGGAKRGMGGKGGGKNGALGRWRVGR